MFLPETHQAAGQHHHQDDDDPGEIGFFAGLQRQPEVGEETDTGQGHQHIDERVVESLEQLHQSVWRTVVGDLVVAVPLQAALGIQFSEAGGGGVDVGQGDGQAVLGFAGGTHRQLVAVTGGAGVAGSWGFYSHGLCSCRLLAARHSNTQLIKGERKHVEPQVSDRF